MSESPIARCAKCGTVVWDEPAATCVACGYLYFTQGSEVVQWAVDRYVAAVTEPAAREPKEPPPVVGAGPSKVPVLRGKWSVLPATIIFALTGCLVATLVAAGVVLTRENAVDRAARIIIADVSGMSGVSDTLSIVEHLDESERSQVARRLRKRAVDLAVAPTGSPESHAQATALLSIAADLKDAESARFAAEIAVNDANLFARSDPRRAAAEYKRGAALFNRAAELYAADGTSAIADACRLNEQTCLRSIAEISKGGAP